MAKFLFFSGKGGVGKTTVAAASAIEQARSGRRTLIVTTDPASNLADVFEQPIGHQITAIEPVPGLSAMEIDPDQATAEYRERVIGPFRGLLPAEVIASLEEQLNSPCTTEMASFDRFVDFLDHPDFEVVVFDTAPTGHTIRLLELPVDWSRHIEESSRGSGQTCLGPVQAIQESRDKYERATALLKNTEETSFTFVMRPEELSLYETRRAMAELEKIGIVADRIVINGVLPAAARQEPFFAGRWQNQQEVLTAAKQLGRPLERLYLRPDEVKGITALSTVADELFHDVTPAPAAQSAALSHGDWRLTPPDLDRLWLPQSGQTKLIFFTGKGGTGKTTVSCMAAARLAAQGCRTLLVTTDPAAHIAQVLDCPVGSEPGHVTANLDAVNIDQETAVADYKRSLLEDARGKYSQDMLLAMEEELNSPCTEEMAAFYRFAELMERRDYDAIVFDTAPTGHTLRLLELPFDYARQVELMVAANAGAAEAEITRNRFAALIDQLKDPRRTVFCLVLYPEATPVAESYRALLDLRASGIEPQLVVANMVLPEAGEDNAFLASRRAMQGKYLQQLEKKFQLPVLTVPWREYEVKGLERLAQAWQPAFGFGR